MWRTLELILRFILGIILIALCIVLMFKIKDEFLVQKALYEEAENKRVESEYILNVSNKKLEAIKTRIEEELNIEVELADVGAISEVELYFVTKVDNEYKYIVSGFRADGTEFFEIAKADNFGKYIVSLEAIGLNECIYTEAKDYNVNKLGEITYSNNK